MISRSPIKRRRPGKPRRGRVRDPKYLAWLREQWCAICEFRPGSEAGTGHIEAAHVGERGLGQKSDDRAAIPLCVRHHRTGADSHHVLGKKFWAHHRLDRDLLVAACNAEFEAQRSVAA